MWTDNLRVAGILSHCDRLGHCDYLKLWICIKLCEWVKSWETVFYRSCRDHLISGLSWLLIYLFPFFFSSVNVKCSPKWVYTCSIVTLINVDEDGVRYVPVRPRPPLTLLRHYRNPWKAAYHHFQRYSDIKVKGRYLSNILSAFYVWSLIYFGVQLFSCFLVIMFILLNQVM